MTNQQYPKETKRWVNAIAFFLILAYGYLTLFAANPGMGGLIIFPMVGLLLTICVAFAVSFLIHDIRNKRVKGNMWIVVHYAILGIYLTIWVLILTKSI